MCRNLNIHPGIFIKGLFCRELNALHDEYEQKKIFEKKWGGPWRVRKSQKVKNRYLSKFNQIFKKNNFFLFFLKGLEKC